MLRTDSEVAVEKHLPKARKTVLGKFWPKRCVTSEFNTKQLKTNDVDNPFVMV
jgi:hypothetical protein